MSEHALIVGEALIDEVHRPDGTDDAYVGGSPANVAMGLSRLGRSTELLTWIGLDEYGRMIRQRLADDNVALVRGSESALRTSIASAVLDETGAANYEFDLQWAINPTAAPSPRPLVVHTGSIAAVLRPGSDDVRDLLTRHRPHATVTYDPNVRPSLMGSPVTAGQIIDQTVALTDVVKVSDEDLEWLRPSDSIKDQAARWLDMGPKLVVVTRGSKGATAFTADGRTLDVTAPVVQVADTVGAGDSFMGGLIDGLWTSGLLGAPARDSIAGVDLEALNWILTRCVGIAAVTVSRPGANPPTKAELGEG